MKKYDVTALGELLVDFTENGLSENGNPLLEANPGGAPCNVLAMLSKLGKNTAFIGKVGTDSFGEMLKNAAEDAGIDISGVTENPQVHTTLAFVHTLANGEREFSFYRNPGADMTLCESDIRVEFIENSSIFHFGSLSLTDEPCRLATEKAVNFAKSSGAAVSFDPNLREPLWKDLDEARERIEYGLSVCDILKISDNEIEWFMNDGDYYSAAVRLKKQYNIPLVFVTLGKDGSMAFSDAAHAKHSGYNVGSIEATGAGDTFTGCVLDYIVEKGFYSYSETELGEMLSFANAAAALITTRKGALKVMPSRGEIERLMKNNL